MSTKKGLVANRKNPHFFSEKMQYFKTFCVYSIIEAVKNCVLICKQGKENGLLGKIRGHQVH